MKKHDDWWRACLRVQNVSWKRWQWKLARSVNVNVRVTDFEWLRGREHLYLMHSACACAAQCIYYMDKETLRSNGQRSFINYSCATDKAKREDGLNGLWLWQSPERLGTVSTALRCGVRLKLRLKQRLTGSLTFSGAAIIERPPMRCKQRAKGGHSNHNHTARTHCACSLSMRASAQSIT